MSNASVIEQTPQYTLTYQDDGIEEKLLLTVQLPGFLCSLLHLTGQHRLARQLNKHNKRYLGWSLFSAAATGGPMAWGVYYIRAWVLAILRSLLFFFLRPPLWLAALQTLLLYASINPKLYTALCLAAPLPLLMRLGAAKRREAWEAGRVGANARFCSECRTYHPAVEGDMWIWEDPGAFWFVDRRMYLCLGGMVVDITEVASCGNNNMFQDTQGRRLPANTHAVQYRLGRNSGAKAGGTAGGASAARGKGVPKGRKGKRR
ncbi:hypothetical protein TSOC_008776 [Tetrabaena socialis]|uniref:Cleavage inducing molecular chaperone Jiv domain-containing protein n=1 Tax=Tetrabaena socialis TaxID=47790 RepID=A0A2J7ZXL1_9CHLO|nr:hypothetical protein TSOC_008776 [Tetrabaena socialis]|eukprot:PNH05011.1 hypothetical protein TSOC_008776 [Tetrabaena socialis]